MTGVLGYARTFFVGGSYTAEPLATLDAEVARLHEMLAALSRDIDSGAPPAGVTPERLLQGPLADAMTHVGQLAMLRRQAGDPIPPENFLKAQVDASNVGPSQPDPVAYGNRHGSWNPSGVLDE